MVIIAALIALFALFFLVKKHAGPAHLAVIAGLSVYEMFGKNLADWLNTMFPAAPLDLLEIIIYLALVAGFPLLLYLRSPRGGLGGIIHILDAAIFAIVLTALIAPALAHFFTFDSLATNISDIISAYEGWVVLAGIVTAYLDILIYKGHPY